MQILCFNNLTINVNIVRQGKDNNPTRLRH